MNLISYMCRLRRSWWTLWNPRPSRSPTQNNRRSCWPLPSCLLTPQPAWWRPLRYTLHYVSVTVSGRIYTDTSTSPGSRVYGL